MARLNGHWISRKGRTVKLVNRDRDRNPKRQSVPFRTVDPQEFTGIHSDLQQSTVILSDAQ